MILTERFSHLQTIPTYRRIFLSPIGVTLAGLVVNVLLSLLKIAAGLLMHSGTLVADGIHSAGDLVSDVVVLVSLDASYKEPDEQHPYGHRRIQTLASMLIGMLVIGAAVSIGVAAATHWRSGVSTAYGWGPFCIAMASVVVKELLYRLTNTVGRRTGDAALLANAWHHRSDAFTSLAAAAGMAGVAIGGAEWGFLDHITAIGLSGVLLGMGLKLCFSAGQELIDRAPAKATRASIAAIIADTEGVHTYHAFRMRQSAGKLEMDVHIQVKPTLTVAAGHDIATEVRARILNADANVTSVIIHVEPLLTDDA